MPSRITPPRQAAVRATIPATGAQGNWRVDFSPRNPLRPLDWRWRPAMLDADVKGRPRWFQGDDRTRRARRHFRRRYAQEEGGQHPSKADRPLSAADRLRSSAMKDGVEPRLLAGQDDRTVCAPMRTRSRRGHRRRGPVLRRAAVAQVPRCASFAKIGSRLFDPDGGLGVRPNNVSGCPPPVFPSPDLFG